jgi:hypothetical protein
MIHIDNIIIILAPPLINTKPDKTNPEYLKIKINPKFEHRSITVCFKIFKSRLKLFSSLKEHFFKSSLATVFEAKK